MEECSGREEAIGRAGWLSRQLSLTAGRTKSLERYNRRDIMKKRLIASLVVGVSMLGMGSVMAQEPVKIGLVIPLTGATAVYGKDGKAAADWAAREINEAGGILGGRQLELIYEDEKGTPQDGVAGVQKMINQAHVDAIIAGMNSSVTLAESAITKNKVLHINPGAQADAITNQGSPWLFQINNTSSTNANVFHDYLIHGMKPKTIAYMGENTEFSKALLENLQGKLKDSDIEMVEVATYDVHTTDFTSILSRLKAAAPEMLYVVDAAPARTAQIWKQVRQMGGFPMEVQSAGTVFGPSITASEGAMEGVISGDIFITDGSEGEMLDFIEKARKETGGEPNKVTMVVYEAVHILAEAMDKAGTSTDYQKISDTMRSETWSTPRGNLRFDEKGRAIAPYFYIQEVKGDGVTLREVFEVQ